MSRTIEDLEEVLAHAARDDAWKWFALGALSVWEPRCGCAPGIGVRRPGRACLCSSCGLVMVASTMAELLGPTAPPCGETQRPALCPECPSVFECGGEFGSGCQRSRP